ncbi:MAG: hypothetical protein ACE1Z9_08100, partial [Acidimicrobiia bacterium]
MASVTDTFPAIPKTTAPPPPDQPRRKGRGFFKRAFLVVLVLGVLSMFGAIAYVNNTAGRIT